MLPASLSLLSHPQLMQSPTELSLSLCACRDGVLVANHGAAASEEFPDADGAFCASVRGIVGEDCVVGVCLDMHANLSPLVVQSTNVCVVWRTTPHLDTFERGQKTAELVLATMRGEITPVQWIENPPLIMNISQHFTASEPML